MGASPAQQRRLRAPPLSVRLRLAAGDVVHCQRPAQRRLHHQRPVLLTVLLLHREGCELGAHHRLEQGATLSTNRGRQRGQQRQRQQR